MTDHPDWLQPPRFQRRRQTRWQQFWRSPWTWLIIWINQVFAVTYHWMGHGWGWTLFAWAILIYAGAQFFDRANKRWGRP